MGVAHGTAEVRTVIISSILAEMGQTKSPSTSNKNIDGGALVICENQRVHVDIIEV